jgi:SMC interacting uncharacterized protein involved in chromosome segregation
MRESLDRFASDLRGEIQTLAGDLRGDMQALAGDLRGEMRTLAGDLRGDMRTLAGDLRGEMQTLAGDLRGEIRFSAAETRAYVDERIQASGGSLLQEMGEFESRTRRHFDVVAESLRSDIRAIAEGMVASREQTDRLLVEQAARTDRVEKRVLRLEVRTSSLKADQKPRRPRRR